MQEALHNVVKHSGATRVSVALTLDVSASRLLVEDDGAGFDPSRVGPGHLGLRIMKERADSVGAALEVVSAPGKGCRITVIWADRSI
jgi:signal transduction histidine kinase